jgi:hypothetical protein
VRDVFIRGDCQVAAREIAAGLGWADEMEELYRETRAASANL